MNRATLIYASSSWLARSPDDSGTKFKEGRQIPFVGEDSVKAQVKAKQKVARAKRKINKPKTELY